MQIIEQASKLITSFAPLAVFALAVLTAWGILKWLKKLGIAFKELSESPASFVFGIIVIVIFMWIYFSYIAPLLKGF